MIHNPKQKQTAFESFLCINRNFCKSFSRDQSIFSKLISKKYQGHSTQHIKHQILQFQYNKSYVRRIISIFQNESLTLFFCWFD